MGRCCHTYGNHQHSNWTTELEALTYVYTIVALGEIANFAAYAFAPAILVTPLGALSVLIG